MVSQQTSVRPGFAMPEGFFQDVWLMKTSTHPCDVDENLWPNPQHRVDDNVEVQ